MYETGQWELANNSQSLAAEPGDPQYSDSGGIGSSLFLPYVREVSGRIETNTAWCGYVTVLGDVTVADTARLTIYPGTKVKFASRTELAIEGSLVAEGMADSKITFTSASQTPKPGDWYGIRVFNGGSAEIQYATIEYSDCGVSFDSAQGGNVISCAIKDHSVYGIRGCFTDDLYICGNTISMPVLQCDDPRGGGDSARTAGIYLEDATAQVMDNQIVGGYYGILGVGLDSATVIKGSSNLEQVLEGNVVGLALYSGSRPIVSDNKINEYRDIGVACYESYPLLGDSFIPGTGNNSIIPGPCSPQYAVYCEGVTDTIKAENNWWGESPPDPTSFYGPVDYDPWLVSTGVEEPHEPSLPDYFSLAQNYPNPFNPVTRIKYGLPRDCWVRLDVYNILGQKVATLVDGEQKAGYRVAHWNGRSQSGAQVASGVYFYRIKTADFRKTRKMILLR